MMATTVSRYIREVRRKRVWTKLELAFLIACGICVACGMGMLLGVAIEKYGLS